jgi:hypothetical protein
MSQSGVGIGEPAPKLATMCFLKYTVPSKKNMRLAKK